MMKNIDYRELFDHMRPGFFEQESIRSMPEEFVFAEMVMELDDLSLPPQMLTPVSCPAGITFGDYIGDIDTLHDAVRKVNGNWVQFFTEGQRIYCAFDGESIASFCIVDDMGRFGAVRVGGPGCVGTVPEYRRRGIGLEMVRRATASLRRNGFDLSWIHYTPVESWYAKLGYRPVMRWNSKGTIPIEQ